MQEDLEWKKRVHDKYGTWTLTDLKHDNVCWKNLYIVLESLLISAANSRMILGNALRFLRRDGVHAIITPIYCASLNYRFRDFTFDETGILKYCVKEPIWRVATKLSMEENFTYPELSLKYFEYIQMSPGAAAGNRFAFTLFAKMKDLTIINRRSMMEMQVFDRITSTKVTCNKFNVRTGPVQLSQRLRKEDTVAIKWSNSGAFYFKC